MFTLCPLLKKIMNAELRFFHKFALICSIYRLYKALSEEAAAKNAAELAKAANRSSFQSREKAREALEMLNHQEEYNKQKMLELEKIIADDSLGIVTRNKANAELAILLSEDPVQLRSARIKQEAAMKKMNDAVNKSIEVVSSSEVAFKRATNARKEAIELKESSVMIIRLCAVFVCMTFITLVIIIVHAI